MPSSTLTSKGQTTIPKEVREHLRLETGDEISFIIQEDGSVVLKPASLHVKDLKGVLHRKNQKPVSIHAMNQAVQSRFRSSR